MEEAGLLEHGRGVEIFTSSDLSGMSAVALGRADFYGTRLGHYVVPRESPDLEAALEKAGSTRQAVREFIGSIKAAGTKPGGSRPQVMAIVNATPDSFYPGSRSGSREHFIDEVVEAHPDIIDVGGESTRPGAAEISASEEISRLALIIDYLTSSTSIPLSLDTRHPDVLSHFGGSVRYANDVTGFTNPAMVSAVSEHSLECITMHMRGNPGNMQSRTGYVDIMPEILDHLLDSSSRLQKSGIGRDRIILDPGIGFSKDANGNLEILRDIESMKIGYRTLVGASRKSFIGRITGEDTHGRLSGTIATSAYLAMRGVDIIRVHDPKENLQAVKVIQAIRAGKT